MSGHMDTIARFEVGSMREQFLNVQVTLMNVAGDIAPLDGTPVIGLPDTHFRVLRTLESRFALLDAEKVGSVGGAVAGSAIRGYQQAFRGIHETYGLASGPDRDAEGAEALLAALRDVASRALGHFTAYVEAVKAMSVPTFAEYEAALVRRRLDPKPTYPAQPRPTTPRVRLPFEGPDTATRARTAVGYAFGGLSAVYFSLKAKPTKHAGMLALADLSGITSYVGAKSSTLSRRCAADDAVFAAYVEGVSDDIDVLYQKLEDEIALREAPPEAVPALADMVLAHARRAAEAVRRVERAAADQGYPIAGKVDGTFVP